MRFLLAKSLNHALLQVTSTIQSHPTNLSMRMREEGPYNSMRELKSEMLFLLLDVKFLINPSFQFFQRLVASDPDENGF